MFTSSALAMTVIPGFLTAYDPKFIRPKEKNIPGKEQGTGN
jgi:hypothetical protein